MESATGALVSVTTPTSPRPNATDMSGLPGTAGTVVVGYRGTFAFGRDGMADVCFRKLTRILIHGKVLLCFLRASYTILLSQYWIVWSYFYIIVICI